MNRFLTVLPAILVSTNALVAAERDFSYTHQSDVLAPGQHELELWTTWQGGREDQQFRRVDSRLEIEIGIAPQTQAAIYLNHRRTSSNGVSESEFEGVSFELKRRLTDPASGGPGFALYSELTVNGGETEIEAKAIGDYHTGAWTFAANLTAEAEWEDEPNANGDGATTHEEFGLLGTVGITRQLADGWSLGLEAENRNPISEGTWESSTIWAGPVLHVSNPSLWATLTVLPQIANLGGRAEHGERELSDNSRLEIRLLLGTSF